MVWDAYLHVSARQVHVHNTRSTYVQESRNVISLRIDSDKTRTCNHLITKTSSLSIRPHGHLHLEFNCKRQKCQNQTILIKLILRVMYFHWCSWIVIYCHVFSCMFIELSLISCISKYFQIFTRRFMYFNVVSCLFKYFHVLS